MIRVLSVGLLGLSLFGAEPVRDLAKVTTTELVNFAPGGTIRLDGSHGSVSVEGWDRPEVEVTVTRSKPGLFGTRERERLQHNLQQVIVKTERRSDQELVISTTFPAHEGLFFAALPPKTRVGVDMEYQIRAPRESHIAIHHKDGEVLITEISGEIEATARTGDIVVMLAGSGKYAIDAKAKMGTVYSDFGDARHTGYLFGERFDNGQGRRVFLRVGFGGISIQSMPAVALPTETR